MSRSPGNRSPNTDRLLLCELASPALAPLPRDRPAAQPHFYRPELDVLRFIAFFSVFIAHLENAPVATDASPLKAALLHLYAVVVASGAFGMCIFFLLSAYLITELLIRERAATGSIHLRAFYTRRILRIWPLYFGLCLPATSSGCCSRIML